MLFDLHVHTVHSPCSRLRLDEILRHGRARGLDGVCVTDHDTMAAGSSVCEGVQEDGLCVIIGMEYATEEGDFLLFGPFENLHPGLPAEDVLRLVRDVGGAAVAAHPCRAKRPAGESLARRGFVTCVERVNGRNSQEENRLSASWAGDMHLPATAGSDAHTVQELGRAPTLITAAVRSRADFIAALRNGHCEPAVAAPYGPSSFPEIQRERSHLSL